MGAISWILFGALAGWLANLLLGVKDERQGCIKNVAIGVVGAVLGAIVYRLVTGRGVHFGWDLHSMGVAVLGAVLLLLITGAHKKRSGT